MTKEIVKKETTKITKIFNPEKMRTDVVLSMVTGCEPNNILKELDNKLTGLTGKKIDFTKDKNLQKLLRNAGMILGLDNHHALIGAMKEDFRPLAIEFANTLAKEYDCKTPSEKALSQIVVNSYIRLLDDSRRYNDCSDTGEYLSEGRTKHLAMLSKQMDRANRQFLSALTTLKQMKSPPIQISVKTNTAFIAQNQQLNNNPSPNEINSP